MPRDRPTIQQAVDRARPGDLVLIAAGEYHESITVTTPRIVIRGVDRNAVVVDGKFAFENGFTVKADGVAVENLTVRNFNANGVLFSGLINSRPVPASRWSAIEPRTSRRTTTAVRVVRLRGVPGCSSTHARQVIRLGLLHRAVQAVQRRVRDVIGERNAIGYEGTNSSTDVFIVSSTFSHNRVGITTGSQDLELLAPQGGATIAANRVLDNDDPGAPSTGAGAFGYGIAITGGTADLVTKNRVTGHDGGGILLIDLGRFATEQPGRGKRQPTTVSISPSCRRQRRRGDRNCFSGNTFTTSSPVSIEIFLQRHWLRGPSLSLAGTCLAGPILNPPASSQPNMPNAATAPPQPPSTSTGTSTNVERPGGMRMARQIYRQVCCQLRLSSAWPLVQRRRWIVDHGDDRRWNAVQRRRRRRRCSTRTCGGRPICGECTARRRACVERRGRLTNTSAKGARNLSPTVACRRSPIWLTSDVIIADPRHGRVAMVARWRALRRPPAVPRPHPLDRVIAISVSLAATQRDNPLLVQQSDARFLGRDAIDGHPMDRYRYKDRAVYWVGVDDGLLHRLEATINGFAGLTTFDLRGHGPRPVTLPAHDEVLDTPSLPADALAQLEIVPTSIG